MWFHIFNFKDIFSLLNYSRSRQKELLRGILITHPQAKLIPQIVDYGIQTFSGYGTGQYYTLDQFKADIHQVLDVQVESVPLPSGILGAFVPPQKDTEKPQILLNKSEEGFQLSNLGHEMGHVVAYLNRETPPTETIYFRSADIIATLEDPEEVFADTLMAIGTIPKDEFKRLFCNAHDVVRKIYTWVPQLAVIRFAGFIMGHFPELTQNFAENQNQFFHKVLTVQSTHLRMIAYEEFGV